MNPNNLILSPPGTIVDVLACLFFPPGAAAAGRCAAGLAKLKVLYLGRTQITDAGCAALAAALDSGALPALEEVSLEGIPASAVAKAAVGEALAKIARSASSVPSISLRAHRALRALRALELRARALDFH